MATVYDGKFVKPGSIVAGLLLQNTSLNCETLDKSLGYTGFPLMCNNTVDCKAHPSISLG